MKKLFSLILVCCSFNSFAVDINCAVEEVQGVLKVSTDSQNPYAKSAIAALNKSVLFKEIGLGVKGAVEYRHQQGEKISESFNGVKYIRISNEPGYCTTKRSEVKLNSRSSEIESLEFKTTAAPFCNITQAELAAENIRCIF